MGSGIKPDLRRLLACLALALIVGIVVGQVFLCLFLALLLFLVWYHRALCGFLNFIKYGAEDNLPDLPGVVNELIREFDILRSHYRQRESKLAGFLNRFQEATAALPDAVIVASENGNIEWANNLSEQYLGVRWPQDMGQRLPNLIRYPELAEFLKRQQIATADSEVLVITSPVDQQLSLEIRVQVYGNGYLLLVARDVTDIHRVEKMRKDFIANASHELRSPLTVIAGYLEAFDEDPNECPKPWQSKVSQMRAQAGRMQRLIDDLLKLSSLESAKDENMDEEVSVSDLLTGICKEAQTLSGELDHQFSVDLDSEIWLRGNHQDIYSAFSNIIFNAVQYTPALGAISIRWHQDENGAHLEVRDSGEGIEAEHIPRLTERFYRVDAGRSRAKGGTGLGLAIVKHALARHNGSLEIQSKLARGSVFICHFPPERIIIRQSNMQLSG